MPVSAVIVARKVSALSRKSHPVPIAVMARPATAGPTIRAVLNVVAFSATAFGSCALPTISTTKDCRTGVSTAAAQPSSRHSA